MEIKDEIIEQAKELLKTQGSPGNWDFDPYMHGMYNGMELILAVIEDRDPVYKDGPKEWVKDKPSTETPKEMKKEK
jgi:hypothetical protein